VVKTWPGVNGRAQSVAIGHNLPPIPSITKSPLRAILTMHTYYLFMRCYSLFARGILYYILLYFILSYIILYYNYSHCAIIRMRFVERDAMPRRRRKGRKQINVKQKNVTELTYICVFISFYLHIYIYLYLYLYYIFNLSVPIQTRCRHLLNTQQFFPSLQYNCNVVVCSSFLSQPSVKGSSSSICLVFSINPIIQRLHSTAR